MKALSNAPIEWFRGTMVLAATASVIGATVSTCRADFSYAGTEYSLEWLIDASRAVAAGKVTACNDQGAFTLRVDTILKCAEGFQLEEGQIIEGPCLGRARHPESDPHTLPWRLGWPDYSDSSTYPTSERTIDPGQIPVLRRVDAWDAGDRCVIFFGPDSHTILQIVDLDQPLHIEVDFLAVDMRGKAIAASNELLQRIVMRVAAGRAAMRSGRVKVSPLGFVYWPPGSQLDGADYYFVLAPPDPTLKDYWRTKLNEKQILAVNQSTQEPVEVGLVEARVTEAMAIWYWFYADKTAKDFSDDLKRDFDRTLRSFLGSNERHPGENVQEAHRINFRNYPLGWSCSLSADGKSFAYLEGQCVYLYQIDGERPKPDEWVFRGNDADREKSAIAFSPSDDFFAYTDRDGDLLLYDLDAEKIAWKTKLPLEIVGEEVACTRLLFSDDGKYLAQEMKRGLASLWHRSGPRVVYVWDTETGDCTFAPYDDWQRSLWIGGFNSDSQCIRLSKPSGQSPADAKAMFQIWDIETGQVVQELPR